MSLRKLQSEDTHNIRSVQWRLRLQEICQPPSIPSVKRASLITLDTTTLLGPLECWDSKCINSMKCQPPLGRDTIRVRIPHVSRYHTQKVQRKCFASKSPVECLWEGLRKGRGLKKVSSVTWDCRKRHEAHPIPWPFLSIAWQLLAKMRGTTIVQASRTTVLVKVKAAASEEEGRSYKS